LFDRLQHVHTVYKPCWGEFTRDGGVDNNYNINSIDNMDNNLHDIPITNSNTSLSLKPQYHITHAQSHNNIFTSCFLQQQRLYCLDSDNVCVFVFDSGTGVLCNTLSGCVGVAPIGSELCVCVFSDHPDTLLLYHNDCVLCPLHLGDTVNNINNNSNNMNISSINNNSKSNSNMSINSSNMDQSGMQLDSSRVIDSSAMDLSGVEDDNHNSSNNNIINNNNNNNSNNSNNNMSILVDGGTSSVVIGVAQGRLCFWANGKVRIVLDGSCLLNAFSDNSFFL
jgi:hypothetical protein